jgi:SnoaL-like domain
MSTDDHDKSDEVSIEHHIRELRDLRAIEALKYRYVEGADAVGGLHDLEVLMSCFVSDARWSAPHFGDYSGKEAIREFFASPGEDWALHYVANPRITVASDGLSATGRFHLYALLMDPQGSTSSTDAKRGSSAGGQSAKAAPVVIAGIYSDTFVKIESEWYIKEIVIDIRYTSASE